MGVCQTELSKSERIQVRNVYGLPRARLYGYAFAHGLLQSRQPLTAVRCYADWRTHFEQSHRLVTVEDRGAEFVRAKGWDTVLMDEAEAWVTWGRGRFKGLSLDFPKIRPTIEIDQKKRSNSD